MSGIIAGGSQETVIAGVEMFKQGGNAVDATVAATFVSFMAEIGVVHMGGSGIAQVYEGKTGKGVTYDFFSNAPGLGHTLSVEEMDFAEVMIDFGPTTQDFHLGRASVAVPGNIFGLCRMARDYGRLPLSILLQPAIRLAKEGIMLEPFQAETCELLKPLYTYTAGMREIFLVDGHMVSGGERFYIPNLAETLTTLAQEGESFMRFGRLGQALVQDQMAYGGLLTQEDLNQYQVWQEAPIRLPYRDFEVLLPPPSSTGGALIAFALKVLAAFPVMDYRHGSFEYVRLMAEVMATGARARRTWDQWIQKLPAKQAVTTFLADDFVRPYIEQVRAILASDKPSEMLAEPKSSNNTTHLSVIDSEGLAVSLTHTAGESAGYVVPGTGFIPNNIMGEADLHPHGFHTTPAGKRIGTMMTPTLILKDGNIRLVLGSGGSIRIRSAVLQVISNLLDFHMKLNDAVNVARVHVENGILQCEAGYNTVAIDKLASIGYQVNRWDKRSIYFGGAHSTSRTLDGRLVGAGDNRRGGTVAEG